jgi:single-strand DNA-binding protein
MNRVVLTGRLTRDPEMRSLASGKTVTTFTVASNEFLGGGKEKAEYHPVVTWDRLAEIAGRYLGKGQQVAIEGRLQTRSWDDEKGARHWKTEIVASHVEMLSGRRKKDYEAQQAPTRSLTRRSRSARLQPRSRSRKRRSIQARPDDDEEVELDEPRRTPKRPPDHRNLSRRRRDPLRAVAALPRAGRRTRRTTRRGSRRRASAARPRASCSRRRSR